MPLDLEKVRSQIPTLQRCIYMNCGWAGPRPSVVTNAMKERLDYEAQEGPGHAVVVITGKETADKAKAAVAKFIGVTPEELAFTQNTTEAINTVIWGLPLKSGDEVVTCDLEHPSVLIPCLYLQKRRGVTLKVVKIDPTGPKEDLMEKFNSAITSRTRLVCMSHVQYSVGLRMPVKELVALAHQRGAQVLVDGAQAVGHVQVNVPDLGADYYVFPAHKWLLGPEGLGIMYIRKELLGQVEPLILAEDAVSAFDLVGQFVPNDKSVAKFTPSTQMPALYCGLLAAVEYLQGLGIANIEAQIMESAALMKKALPKLNGAQLLSHTEGELASGLVSFAIKGLEPSEVATGLFRGGAVVARWVDYPPCTRLSIGFYNNDRDLNSAFGVLKKVAANAGTEEVLNQIRQKFF